MSDYEEPKVDMQVLREAIRKVFAYKPQPTPEPKRPKHRKRGKAASSGSKPEEVRFNEEGSRDDDSSCP